MRSIIVVLLLIATRSGICYGQDQAPALSQLKNSPAPAAPIPEKPKWVPLSANELVGTYFIGGFGTKYSLKLKDDGTFEQIDSPRFVGLQTRHVRSSAPSVLYGQYGVQNDSLWLEYKYKVEDLEPDEQKADEPKTDKQKPRHDNQRKQMNAGMCFIPVRWDGRLYLLTPLSGDIQREVALFCHKIYFGEIPLGPAPDEKHPHFYLREGDENKSVSGVPLFPKEWQGYLLTKPITGKVLTFTNGGQIIPNFENPAFSEISYAKVTLNIGAADGVKWEALFADNKGNVFFPQNIEEHSTMLIDFDQREIDDLTDKELSTHPIPSSKP